jgi:hypothetical protein
VHRYMFDDWKPYIYRTDDYGRSWTHLTGPNSGFPQDHPARVVREDPDREGLLYAGTEFGVFFSFDNGASWQPLQRNLPASVISDMKVYRKDLIVATQGRGFWILDNLTPLHEVDRARADTPYLFTPREAYRGQRGTEAVIQYHLPVAAPVSLEIVDGSGAVIRTFTAEASAPPQRAAATAPPSMPGDEDAPPQRFAAGAAARLGNAAGFNSFTWDLRRDGGLAVVPGRYTARLTVSDAAPLTAPVEVRLHPNLAADGITAADLEAHYDLALKVAQLAADVRTLQDEMRSARQRLQQAGGNVDALRNLDALEQLVVSRSGQAYAQPMLAAQVSYLNGIVSRGDNRPHRDAFERYQELRGELDRIRAEVVERTGAGSASGS